MSVKESQLLIRIEKDLEKRLNRFAEKRESTKSEIVRLALESYIAQMEEAEDDQIIEDYIRLRITPEEFKKLMDFKKIPKDLENSRSEYLKKIEGDK